MSVENTFKFKDEESKEKRTEVYLRCLMIIAVHRRQKNECDLRTTIC